MATKITPAPLTRSLSAIADEIAVDWGDKLTRLGPDFGFGPAQNPARPYWDAMRSLTHLDQHYGADSGDGIVRYFISNAGTWKGEKAKAIKAELRAALADFDANRGR